MKILVRCLQGLLGGIAGLSGADLFAGDVDARLPHPRAVLEIHAQAAEQGASSRPEFRQVEYGTGVVLAKDERACYAVTAFHVVNRAARIVGVFYSGASFTAPLVGTDHVTGLAYLAFEDPEALQNCAPLRLASREPAVMEDVWAFGNPDGAGIAVTKGILSRERNLPEGRIFEVDIRAGIGFSGGPLMNRGGEVVGLIQSIDTRNWSPRFTYAVPADRIQAGLEKLLIMHRQSEGNPMATPPSKENVSLRNATAPLDPSLREVKQVDSKKPLPTSKHSPLPSRTQKVIRVNNRGG